MRNKLINQLIWKNQKKAVLLFAAVGMYVGLFISILSVQFYFDFISTKNNDQELFQDDYVVINKQVSLLNTLKLVNTGFSQAEIDTIKNQIFVKKIGLITPNKFKVGAYTDGNDEFPEFYAEMFFESVPDEFIDIKRDDWQWNENSSFIPIVIPRDYLKLYNFGFAQSQNLPQISEEIASKAMADFIIEGQGQRLRMKGKIVGFTDKINSILVPQSFMDWANNKLGRRHNVKQPSRIILVCNDPSDPAFTDFLRKHHYEANLQKTKSSRLNSLLQIVLSIVLVIGLVITFLAFIIFVVSFKLMISKAHTTIEKLLLLGYHYKVPARIYISIYSLLLFIVFGFSVLSVVFLRGLIHQKFADIGFALESGFSIWMWGFSLGLLFILLISNSLSILLQFKKMARK